MSNSDKNKDYKERFENILDSFFNQDFESFGKEMRNWGKEFRDNMKDFTKDFRKDYDCNVHFGQDSASGMPLVNVVETGKSFRIELLAPGLSKEDFKISLSGQKLHIKVDTEAKTKEGEQYKRREFNFNKFERTVKLPKNADLSKIDAKYKNGILSIVVAKKTESKDEGIEIKVS